jgi:hypothetical protein
MRLFWPDEIISEPPADCRTADGDAGGNNLGAAAADRRARNSAAFGDSRQGYFLGCLRGRASRIRIMIVCVNSKTRNSLQRRFYLFCSDEPRTFKLPWRAGMTWTPQKILVVEAMRRIVPAAVAGVIVDHPIGRGEFIERMREAGDHHHRNAHRPGQPRQAAR